MPAPGYNRFNIFGLFTGLAVFAAVLLLPAPEGIGPEAHRTAAITALMAVWWITEALPLAATALIPIALFPLLGVLPTGEVTAAYGDPNIFLFAGGFFIAMAMQKWNLHERIALNVVARTGTRLNRIVLGFMAATAFMSMWISNTATTLMMLPIATAVIRELEGRLGEDRTRYFSVCIMLGIAYASSVGGMGTLIGTPPNLVMAAQYRRMFPEAPEISFARWMMFAVPLVMLFLPLIWLLMTRVLFRFSDVHSPEAAHAIRARLKALGPMNRGEKVVLGVAVATALSWIFRGDIDLGAFVIPGWADLFPKSGFINDTTVAVFFAVVLFMIPVDLKQGEFALDWEWGKRIPWGVLILFGGGLALAGAFQSTGLVAWLGSKLTMLDGLPIILVVAAVCFMLTFTTELTSNVATTSIMMPILGAAAPAMGMHPLLLMVPATISASCAFMLPVATPPNAIVFSEGKVTVPQMARAGLAINLMGVVLVTLLTYFLGVPTLGITLDQLPASADPPAM